MYPAEGKSTPFQKLVGMTQYMWQHRDILADMGWKLLVLIPKGNTDTQGVGLLETLWKVVE